MVLELDQAYSLPFTREQVYAAWISSETVIPPATAMDINPIVGGHYRLLMKSPDFEARCEGIFSVVEDGRRLRYTWEWNGDGNVSDIDVTFESNDAGTNVRIQHSGFSTNESRDMHASGWDSYIAGFTEHLAKT